MEPTEIENFGYSEHIGLATLESFAKKNSQQKQSFLIGLPKEKDSYEYRTPLTPSNISELIKCGHRVFIERGIGYGAHFEDAEYANAGAILLDSTEAVYQKSNFIVKVNLPSKSEYKYLKTNQVIISGIDMSLLGEELIAAFQKKKITALAYEFIETSDGEIPILRTISELTGGLAIQMASKYLQTSHGGKGIALGGIAGVLPSTVVIIGAGTVGQYAAQAALGLGSHVIVIDKELQRLRRFETIFSRRVITAIANENYISQAAKIADVMVGAMNPRAKLIQPIVSEHVIRTMKKGSVIVDVSINQFRCFETSRKTTQKDPVFSKYGIIHYCVANMTSSVARTASMALGNVITPFLIKFGSYGSVSSSLWNAMSLGRGTYSHKGYITKRNIAERFNAPFKDIPTLLASNANFN